VPPHCRRAEYEENSDPMLEEYLLLLSAFALPEHKYKAYLVLKIGFVRDL